MTEESDGQQIRKLIADWLAASKQHDTEKVLSLIAEDAVFLVAGQVPFGKEAFAQAARQQKDAQVQFDAQSEIVELQIFGPWAFAITKLNLTIERPGADPVARSGNTLTVFRKTDGVWQLARDANLL